jgi:lipopolysaccharide export system protein LptA
VQLDLSGAPVPGRPAGRTEGGIEIDASAVGFNRDTGDATSDAPVSFRFPEGRGSAVGVRYSSRSASLRLGSDVRLRLDPARPGGLTTTVTAKGGLNYDRESGRLRLAGPVEIRKGGRTLETGALIVTLGAEMRPRTAVAEGGSTLQLGGNGRSGRMEARSVAIRFDGRGRAEEVEAGGGVTAVQKAPAAMRLAASRLTAMLDPLDGQPREMDVSGNVRLDAVSGAATERLETDALHLVTAPAAGSAGQAAVRLDRATSAGPATIEWRSGGASLRLGANRLTADFDDQSRIRELVGRAGVRVERRATGETPVVSEADTLEAHFSGGEWRDAEESGDVRARQGSRTAAGERARWMRAENTIELDGNAHVSDPTGQTLAEQIVWNQKSGKLDASGRVRSTYFAKTGGEASVAPSAGPVNVVAARLAANAATGEAVYSGGARLWQGDVAIQAERIDLRRASGELVAEGDVLAAFPQTPHELGMSGSKKISHQEKMSEAVLWRVRAKRLDYRNQGGAEGRTGGAAELDGGVEAWSSDAKISAQRLVLTLRRDSGGRAELTQATASGGVRIRQGARWGQGERLIYLAKPGKFVLTGGRPSLHDTSGNLVEGGRLTFYVADDTILVESSRGSRTVTRHPIPN